MAPDPKYPIAFIRWLMKEQDLAFSPHVLAQIAAEQAKAERERQSSQFEAERARYAMAATEDSPGRRAAMAAVPDAAEVRRRRQIAERRTAADARADLCARQRGIDNW
jgi:hypothetical protein